MCRLNTDLQTDISCQIFNIYSFHIIIDLQYFSDNFALDVNVITLMFMMYDVSLVCTPNISLHSIVSAASVPVLSSVTSSAPSKTVTTKVSSSSTLLVETSKVLAALRIDIKSWTRNRRESTAAATSTGTNVEFPDEDILDGGLSSTEAVIKRRGRQEGDNLPLGHNGGRLLLQQGQGYRASSGA